MPDHPLRESFDQHEIYLPQTGHNIKCYSGAGRGMPALQIGGGWSAAGDTAAAGRAFGCRFQRRAHCARPVFGRRATSLVVRSRSGHPEHRIRAASDRAQPTRAASAE
jgi:hypothetical protein